MIDKMSRKVLKFIAKSGKLNFNAIDNKFGEYSEQIISSLCSEGYLEQIIPYPTFDRMVFTYAITPKGKAYFEEKRIKKTHFWIPIIIDTVLSVTAIVISIIALIN